MNIPNVFGAEHSGIFTTSTIKDLLFDGVTFCANPGVIGNVICDIVKAKNLMTVHKQPDESLKFAFFRHVIFNID